MKTHSFKKLIAVVLSTLMLSSVFTLPLSVNAAQVSNDSNVGVNVNDTITDNEGVVYKFTDKSGVKNLEKAWILTEYNGNASDLRRMYDYKDGYRVVAIGESAFRNNLILNYIAPEENIYRINDYAFYGCTNLDDVLIYYPNKLEYLGKYAFAYCDSLENNYGTNYSDIISEYCFLRCTNIKRLCISSKSIGKGAFSGCNKLSEVILTNTVTDIESYAFENCESLRDIIIPSQVKTIKDNVFIGCTNLTNVVIPDTVTTISDLAFAGCNNIVIHGYEGSLAESYANKNGYDFVKMNKSVPGFTYEILDNKTARITGCTIESSNVTIPSNIDGYPVSSIGYQAFYDNKTIESLVIPNTVTEIRMMAFCNNTNLSSVKLGKNIEAIDKSVFKGCTKLSQISIPDCQINLASGAFSDTAYYKDLKNWENGSLYIGKHLVEIKDKLVKTFKIKSSTISISSDVFRNLSQLTEIEIPDKIQEIKANSFSGCVNLSKITIPDNVKVIGEGAFKNCKSLEEITIPNSVKDIKASAFEDCVKLTKLTLPDKLSTISNSLFKNCSSLAEFSFPAEVHTIDSSAFENCDALAQIVIPRSVARIKSSAFKDCNNLTDISIPDSVTQIGDNAFMNCTNLTQVEIPNSVVSIGASAFAGCTNIKSITLPDKIAVIRNSLFKDCTSLIEVSIPDKISIIESYAFLNCTSLKKITLNNNIVKIGDYALGFSQQITDTEITYTQIPNFTICGYELTEAENYAIKHNIEFIALSEVIRFLKYTILSNGTAKITAYNGANNRTVVIPATIDGYKVSTIGKQAFKYCSNVEEITISNGIKTIELYAFEECRNLKKVYIPDSVTSFGYGVFFNCRALSDIDISDNLVIIGTNSFAHTAYYDDPNNWDNGSLYLENYLIDVDTTLSGIYNVKKGTKLIADSAFIDCNKLTDIVLSKSVKSIGGNAFKNCKSLKNITIPKNVTSISATAFTDCSGFTIYGYSGTTAETFAKNNNIPFVCLDEKPNSFEYAHLGNGTIKITKCISAEENLTIPGELDGYTVTAIDNNAFNGNVDIVNLSFADSITSIGEYAFKNCKELISVTIPKNITQIGYAAFYNCTELTDITLHDNITNFSNNVFFNTGYYNNKNNWDNGVLYIDNYLIKADSTLASEYTIKDGTKAIADSAFLNCESVVEIKVPESLERIGNFAFKGCSNLEKITLPVSVTEIKNNVFANDIFVVIYGYVGSVAEKYASDNNIEFVDITSVKYVLGDIDLDDRVTIQDATLMQRYCAEYVTLNQTQLNLADTDGNGDININDATTIQKIVAAN